MSKIKNSKPIRILAIESSCDETSASIVEVTTGYDALQTVTKSYKQLRRVTNSCENAQLIGTDSNQSKPIVTILSNIVSSQVKLHAKYGGVYPELASREHIRNILPVVTESCEQLLKVTSGYEQLQKVTKGCPATNRNHSKLIETIRNNIDAIAVTTGPGLIGSLLVGVNTAKTLAYTLNKPIYAINHLEGHIYSCFDEKKVTNSYEKLQTVTKSCPVTNSNQSKPIVTDINLPQFPLIALIASGGHTSLVYMKDHMKFKVIGETLDDAAGEAFDKVAKLLDLGYPGGPAVSALAAKVTNSYEKLQKVAESCGNQNATNRNHSQSFVTNRNRFSFPRPMIDSNNFDFSFSGLKTAVLYVVEKLKSKSENLKTTHSIDSGQATKNLKLKDEIVQLICYEFQEAVVDTLVTKTLRAAKKYKVKSVLLCGGVSANARLRQEFNLRLSPACRPASPNRGERGRTNNSRLNFFVPEKSLTGDNAAMIGLAAAYKIALGIKPTPWQKVNADSNPKLKNRQ